MPDEPPSRSTTARDRLIEALQEGFATVRHLSHRTGLSEKQVIDHLQHVSRSLAHRGGDLEREAPKCMKCGFVFDTRERFSTPSRCPECRSERVQAPRFRVS